MWRVLVVGSLTVALLTSACGSGGSKDSGSSASTAPGATSATSAGGATTTTAVTSTTVVAQPQSLDQWEALWAQQRAGMIKRIKDNHWGKSADGKTLTGPQGWTVDLSKCPSGWSDTEGVSDTTIKIGQSIPQSGTYADYGNLAKAIQVLLGYYSDQGFFKDASGKSRRATYTVLDDGYDAARAIPNVDELLDSEKVFAVWTLGSPATLKTYDKVNQRCVPQPMAMTAHAAWGDPVNHPWTTGAPAPTYSTEAILWGSFLEQHIKEFPTDRKLRVVAMVQNNDFGKLYEASFKAFVAQSGVLKDRIDYSSEAIEAQAPTVTDPMTTLAAKKPDVFITMLAGTQCTQIINEAEQDGMKAGAKYLFQPQTCPGSTFINKAKLGGDGSAGDGWWIVNSGIKDAKDPTQQNDPYIMWFNNLLRSKGIDPTTSSNLGLGAAYLFPVVQAIAIAGQLDGGVSRTNFQLALRSMDMTSPMTLPGVRLHMDGLKDAYIIEAGQFQQWDAAKQTWVPRGNIIDLDGQSKLCAWDQSTSQCK
jgi:ABC-type branched-subunit amino acid transport system substrate-binding protein